MATSKYAFPNTANFNGIIPPGLSNDTVEFLDNMVGYLFDAFVRNGVISGWTITASADLKVSTGEGIVSGAHCKSTVSKTISGLTNNDFNYIYAKLQPSYTDSYSDRISPSYATGDVVFVANTSGVAPANSLLVATGTVNSGGTTFTSVNNVPNGRTALRTLIAEMAKLVSEHFSDFVSTGLTWSIVSGLTGRLATGIAYVSGYRIEKTSTTDKLFTASKDTYIDIDSVGTLTYVEVSNGAGVPAVTADSIRIAKVVTDGTGITGITDLRVVGGVGLGTGADGTIAGQLNAKYQVYTTNGTPDTEDTIAHGLGRTPIGFLVVKKDKACDLYSGATSWNATNLYLKCDVANATVTILVW